MGGGKSGDVEARVTINIYVYIYIYIENALLSLAVSTDGD